MSQTSVRGMENLPKQFVSAMRTLFDIMDDKRTGYVKVTDIENRWRDDRTTGLPRGVIENLQKVASHEGLLTFERFCAGLKLSLQLNQERDSGRNLNKDIDHSGLHLKTQTHRPPSAPLLDDIVNQNVDRNWDRLPNSEIPPQHRTVLPQLLGRKDALIKEPLHVNTSVLTASQPNSSRVYGPPKPPRSENQIKQRQETSATNYKADVEKCFVHEQVTLENIDFEEISQTINEHSRGLGDGRSADETQSRLRRTSKRREPRRHTLHNGVDYNLLKRMKQIEQEKDLLLQGLSAVEEAREWYLKQLTEVQEKMRCASRMGAYMEPWNEAHQEKLELLRARVTELNRQLGALAAAWRHGPLSLHMNLALPAATLAGTATTPNNNAALLKSQNRMLSEEVNRKSERITVLEREKSSLIRELLHQRNKSKLIDNFA